VDPPEGGPSVVLRVAQDAAELECERAAVRIAASEGLPVVGWYDVLPAEVLGVPASLSPELPGAPDGDAIHAGALAAELAAVRLPAFGAGASGGRFHALAARWSAEWEARAGVLPERVRDDLPALDTCEEWALVHGDLRPDRVLLARAGGRPTPTALIGWGHACAGDPLVDGGSALALPLPDLARWLDGYGREEAAAWRDDPDVLARLGVYWRTRAPDAEGEPADRLTAALDL
jgi:hypothetical protein